MKKKKEKPQEVQVISPEDRFKQMHMNNIRRNEAGQNELIGVMKAMGWTTKDANKILGVKFFNEESKS